MIDISWSYKTHQRVQGLAVHGEDCFVQCRRTRLVSLDVSTGEERWSAGLANPWGRLAVGQSVVAYLNQHSLLAAHDRTTGDLVWSRDLGGINGWLHAMGDLVLVGGWRHYTPIRALSLLDGSEQWSMPYAAQDFVCTQIHGESRSLITLSPTTGQELRFFDLESGEERQQIAAPGGMSFNPYAGDGEPKPPAASGPVVFLADDTAFIVVSGNPPSVERVPISEGVSLSDQAFSTGPVSFVTKDGELRAWWPSSRRLRHLGKVDLQHAPTSIASLGRGRFIVGASHGRAMVIEEGKGMLAKRQIGKRISTPMTFTNGLAVVGTASAEVLGLQVEPPSDAAT